MIKTYIYWLHLPEYTDLRTQGYIGVARKPEHRFTRHKNYPNTIIENIIKNYGIEKILISILVYNTETYCYEMERILRPIGNIGWNVCKGGGKPPVPMKRKSSIYNSSSQKIKDGMAKITPEQKLNMYLKRDSCDGRKWIHNLEGNHKRVKPNQVIDFISAGWIVGRVMS